LAVPSPGPAHNGAQVGFEPRDHDRTGLAANLYSTVSDMCPKQAIGSVVGLGGMAGSIGGMLFPVDSGRLLDQFRGVDDLNAGYAILFGICALTYLLADALNHLLALRFEPIRKAGA